MEVLSRSISSSNGCSGVMDGDESKWKGEE